MGAVAAIGGAILGGVAGSKKDKSVENSSSSNVSTVEVTPATKEELDAQKAAQDQIGGLQSDLSKVNSFLPQERFAELLKQIASGPNAESIASARAFADQTFAPQQTALNQQLEQQQQAFSVRAAQLGRSQTDPILSARLAQEQIRQQQTLEANKTAFSAQEAVNAPTRMLQNSLAGISQLQQQAITNRQAVYGMGSDFANQLRNFRLATATRTGNSTGSTEQLSGGGTKGAILGALSGAGAGAKIAGQFQQKKVNNSGSNNYAGPDSFSSESMFA